jgi:hypothetical protein
MTRFPDFLLYLLWWYGVRASEKRQQEGSKVPGIGKTVPVPAQVTYSVARRRGRALTLPQARVLQALARMRGPINRAAIIDAVSSPGRQTAIGDSMGYADPERRVRRDGEVGHPSLMTQGLVSEIELDLDGATETGYEITEAGRQALLEFGDIPPLRIK